MKEVNQYPSSLLIKIALVLKIKHQVDEYVATIFPGNCMKKTTMKDTRKGTFGEVTFDGLDGGTVEYVITGLRNYLVAFQVIIS